MFRALAFIAYLFVFSTAAQAQDWEAPERIVKVDFHFWDFQDDFTFTTPPQNDVVGSITLQYFDYMQNGGKITAIDLVIDGYRWKPEDVEWYLDGQGSPEPNDYMFWSRKSNNEFLMWGSLPNHGEAVTAFQYRVNGSAYFETYQGSGTVTHTIAAVPEPETYAMLLAGLGLGGAVARRRRQAEGKAS